MKTGCVLLFLFIFPIEILQQTDPYLRYFGAEDETLLRTMVAMSLPIIQKANESGQPVEQVARQSQQYAREKLVSFSAKFHFSCEEVLFRITLYDSFCVFDLFGFTEYYLE